MNKKLKILIISVIFIIIIATLAFFVVDYNRVKNNKLPIFCIESKNKLLDGGTKEYYGLGYKVIDYNKLDGYDKIYIGTWFMKYDDNLKSYQLIGLTVNKSSVKKSVKITTIENEENNKYSIFYYGIDNVKIVYGNRTIDLKNEFEINNNIINDIMKKVDNDVENNIATKLMYKDGGSIKYSYEDYSIIKMNSIDGNKDLYIGVPEMDMKDIL